MAGSTTTTRHLKQPYPKQHEKKKENIKKYPNPTGTLVVVPNQAYHILVVIYILQYSVRSINKCARRSKCVENVDCLFC